MPTSKDNTRNCSIKLAAKAKKKNVKNVKNQFIYYIIYKNTFK